jgi:hypothetical protein
MERQRPVAVVLEAVRFGAAGRQRQDRRITRARRAASARPRPDRTRASRSVRCSAAGVNDVVMNGMRHMIYKSSVQPRRPARRDSGYDFLLETDERCDCFSACHSCE